jgi:hypothetical protein
MTEEGRLDALFHTVVGRLEKIFGREHVRLAKRERLARNLLLTLTPDEIGAIRSRMVRAVENNKTDKTEK